MKFLFLIMIAIVSGKVFSAELRLLSWNIFMIPKPINFSLQQKRAIEIGKILGNSDYHVVVLQEAFSATARRKIFNRAKTKLPYQYYLKSKKGGSRFAVMASGTWILSRYPMKKLGHHLFSKCTTSDCLADKAVVVHELKLPNSRRFQIANTHLQAWNTTKAVTTREQQLKEVKQVLNKYRKSDVPQILAGDLNVDYFNQDEFHRMLNILNTTLPPLTGPLSISNGYAVDCYNIAAADEGGERLDYIFLLPNQTNSYVKSTQIRSFKGMIKKRQCDLSDHYAVESKIEL